MGGKASRNKGKVGEYQARDYFRSLGMIADRVPSSGAAQGFPGDIKVIGKDGRSFLVEVKFRKNEFKSTYALLLHHDTLYITSENEICIIGKTYTSLYTQEPINALTYGSVLPRNIRKIFTMKQWVKGSDILMIKDNNKQFLFIRYLT